MLILMWAAARAADPERRAIYLEQALEEQRHARMFSRRAAELRGCAGSEPAVSTDAEDLFATLGELRFLAFLHRGERRAVVEFAGYREAFRRAGDVRTSELFASIVDEERRHQDYPVDLIGALTSDSRTAARASRFVTAWEAWRTFRRLGRFFAERLYTASMCCLFVLLAPLGLWVRCVRPVSHGLVLSPEWRDKNRSAGQG